MKVNTQFKESITAEELRELPMNTFDGEIVVIDTQSEIREAVQYLSRFNLVGFDTETKPSFHKGQNHRVALLQLATNDRAYLIRTIKTGITHELLRFFSDPEIIKTGIAIHDDIKALQKLAYFKPAGFFELQNYAQKAGIKNIGLKKLCAIVCGYRISKSQQLTNWEADVLTEQQMVYAATDAWVPLQIHQKLIP